MQKVIFVSLALVCLTAATPNPNPGLLSPYTSPLLGPAVAPAIVTAQSSQVVARSYNGLVTPVVAAAPLVRAAPYVAAPFAYHHNPYVASPYVAASHLHL